MNKTKTLPPIKLPDGTIFRPIGVTTRHVMVTPKPDWDFWRHMPEIKLWQAIALSMNIDPDLLKYSRDRWNGLPSRDDENKFDKHLRLLRANKSTKNGFTPGTLSMDNPDNHGVRPSEFSAWAQSIGWDIPPELAALAAMGDNDCENIVAKVAPAIAENAPVADTVEADTPDETLADLFDPVTVGALEKMFPADKKWVKWAGRAARNGLKDSRVARAKFNPYKAGNWFLAKGVTGWDIARLNRTLANNLPARSKDDAYRLTKGID